jgi:hypothetical protein
LQRHYQIAIIFILYDEIIVTTPVSLDAGVAGEELRARFEHQVAGLRAQCEAEQRTKEQLQLDLDTLRSEYAVQLAQLTRTHMVRKIFKAFLFFKHKYYNCKHNNYVIHV